MTAIGDGSGTPIGDIRADLVEEAIRMLGDRALTALRGPVARGAIPLQALAGALRTSRGVVAREVERRTGDPEASPFDLVVDQIFGARTSEFHLRQKLIERLPASVVVPEGSSGDTGLSILREAIADLLTEAFADPRVRRTTGVAHLLQAVAALALDEDQEGGGPPSPIDPAATEVAHQIRARCTEAVAESLDVQVAGVRLGLMAVGRRTREGVDLAEVVTHLQCTYEGFVLRHLLDPGRYPLARFVDMVWKLVVTLTVPIDGTPGGEPAGAVGVATEAAGTPATEESPADAAAHRLADALAPVAEMGRIGHGVPAVSAKLAVSVLDLVTKLADNHPDLVAPQPNDSGWHPTRMTLAYLLASEYGLDEEAEAARTAGLLIDQARLGTKGRDGWKLALEVLGARLPVE